MRLYRYRTPTALVVVLSILILAACTPSTTATNVSPRPIANSIEARYNRREVMIPMRDGTKLFTVIVTPKASPGPLPILLNRSPYGTHVWGDLAYGWKEFMDEGYIFAFQDSRGRIKSEGQFVMNKPPRDKRDPKSVDESTDTYDAIDWLVKNVPSNNGRVGILGISYPGWLTNMTAIDPHPALKAISPQATMADTWMGDDFFHQGAFRQSYALEYSWLMEASNNLSIMPSPTRFDTYDWYRSFPTLDSLAKAVGAMKWPTWARFAEHPAYDSVWQARAVPRFLTQATVPTLSVGGWWDQEDLYGPQATYKSMEANDAAHRNYIALGPWYHGQWAEEAGDSLGNIKFGSATGEYYRRNVEAPWFAYWLKDKGDGKFAEVTAFDAGAREWKQFDAWPPKTATAKHLYFQPGGKLSFDAPAENGGGDSFVSDPDHPVPYRPRPVEWTYDPRGSRWQRWMTEDQRFVDGRADVLTWQTAPLTNDVAIAGDVTAQVFASTTGSDADWVVKLIDVYPDSIADRPSMGGYELMIAGDIMRGRYRTSFSNPEPIPANTVVPFAVDLHGQAYTFKKGHRIMVQVQSSWFPLYDRNPQTFVQNIFKASAAAYHAQTHRVMQDGAHPSNVRVMVLP
jgi:putative CocE/NonD family hydrolase